MRGVFVSLALLVLLAFSTAVSAQQAGMLIDSRPMANAPAGMQAWRIRYMSSSDKGRAEEMTGVVIAPSGPPSRMGRPVLA